ncbi:hypothetical protein AVEN_182591-1 [Araneus ventricosus]|uniref:Uncharacterized protein n=1 Tax=Araneus ventricosus TaxID=182803 RepID=A0A4Y2WL13_ARAVE|nr:hypothetical protein AVEN_182591-1 [Araneus ventricosus]
MDGGAPIRIADITRADPTLMEYASSSVALSPLLSQEKFRLETSPGRMSTFSGIMPACKHDKSRTRRTRSEVPNLSYEHPWPPLLSISILNTAKL